MKYLIIGTTAQIMEALSKAGCVKPEKDTKYPMTSKQSLWGVEVTEIIPEAVEGPEDEQETESKEETESASEPATEEDNSSEDSSSPDATGDEPTDPDANGTVEKV